MRLQFRYRLRSLLIATAVIPALFGFITYWIALPHRTWSQFVAEVKRNDLDRINVYCDRETLRFSEPYEDGSLPGEIEIWVGNPGSRKFNRPTSFGELSEMQPVDRTWTDYLFGRLRIGQPGSILFGQLEVRRTHVAITTE